MQAGFKWKRFARPELDTLSKTFRLCQEHHNIIEAVDRYKLLSSAHIVKLFCQTPTDVKRYRDHLRELNRRRYIYRPSSQRSYYEQVSGSKPLVYGLDFRGATLLGERPGFARARHAPPSSGNSSHTCKRR